MVANCILKCIFIKFVFFGSTFILHIVRSQNGLNDRFDNYAIQYPDFRKELGHWDFWFKLGDHAKFEWNQYFRKLNLEIS